MILAVLVLILAVLLFGSAAVTSFFGFIAGVIAFCFAWSMFAAAMDLDLLSALGVAIAGLAGLLVVVGLPVILVIDTYERKKYGLPERQPWLGKPAGAPPTATEAGVGLERSLSETARQQYYAAAAQRTARLAALQAAKDQNDQTMNNGR